MRVVAAALAGAALAVSSAPAVPAIPAHAQTPRDLTTVVTAAMLDRSQGSPLIQENAGSEVNVQRRAGRWAFGSAVIKAPRREGAYPEGRLFIARRTADGWRAAFDGEPAFADLATQAPARVISRGEKRTFAANASAAARPLQARTGLALPYTIGKTWKIIGGPHGWSGQPRPWSSIDLDSREANRQVLSAQSGRAYWVCRNGGHIRVIHDNGWTTEYYHLRDEIRPDGDRVRLGQYLGLTSTRIPCGGSAGSNHVHFAIKRGGSFVRLAGNVIGGWNYFEGSRAYRGGAIRNGVRRYTGGDLRNYGPEDGRTVHFEGRRNVPDLGEAEVALRVSGIGGAPRELKVYADIHHTWRGDLQIDLIAPSGRAYRLRSPNSNDDADIIHEQYTVDASAETADGTWRLRAKDVAWNDSGYIDAVFLTF